MEKKEIITNCSLLVCQFTGTMKKNYSFAWFSTSMGIGIVVPSISIIYNILKITSRRLIQILALLSCPVLMWCPNFLLHLRCLLIFQWNANTVHGIIVASLSMTPSSIDSTDCTELNLACLLVLSELHLFCVLIKQTEMTNEKICVFSETLLAEKRSTNCTLMVNF